MSERCESPVSAEQWLDYLLGHLEAREEDRLETHLFDCAACAAQAESLAGLAAALHRIVPPVIGRSSFERFESEGLVEELNVMAPGDVARVTYPPAGKLLVHRLAGTALGQARRIDVALRTPAGEPIARLEDVPFDASRGEVLLACQHHFAETFPTDLVFVLEVVSGEERRHLAEYTVLHRLAGGGG